MEIIQYPSFPMAQTPLTKKELDLTITEFRKELRGRFDNIDATMVSDKQDIISHFNKSQGLQNDRLERIEQEVLEANTKLNAIMDALATRQEVRNLVRELRGQGLTLDESKIFVA